MVMVKELLITILELQIEGVKELLELLILKETEMYRHHFQ